MVSASIGMLYSKSWDWGEWTEKTAGVKTEELKKL